jgi:hypothetical protein
MSDEWESKKQKAVVAPTDSVGKARWRKTETHRYIETIEGHIGYQHRMSSM